MSLFPSDAFTLNAVAQDDFSDVQVPDAPTQPPHTPNAGVEKPVTEALLNQERAETKKSFCASTRRRWRREDEYKVGSKSCQPC